jgi:integrase
MWRSSTVHHRTSGSLTAITPTRQKQLTKASEVLAQAKLGTDVVAVAKAATAQSFIPTLGELAPKYLKARESELRERSHFEVTRYLTKAWKPLHARAIDTITRQHVVAVMDEIETNSGKPTADRARVALSELFGWAIDRGYFDANPTNDIRPRDQNGGRTRTLTEAEIVEVWNACLDDEYGKIVKLLILTGQRRQEIGHLEAREIEIEYHHNETTKPMNTARNTNTSCR